jgi:hypothetical protein
MQEFLAKRKRPLHCLQRLFLETKKGITTANPDLEKSFLFYFLLSPHKKIPAFANIDGASKLRMGFRPCLLL